MDNISCSSGGTGCTGEGRRNGSESMVKQEVVGDGSGAIRPDQTEPRETSPGYSNLVCPFSWGVIRLRA